MCVPLLHRCVGVGAGCRFSPFGPHPATTSCPAKCTPPLGTETGSCRKMRRRFTPPRPSYVYYAWCATVCLAPKGKCKASQEGSRQNCSQTFSGMHPLAVSSPRESLNSKHVHCNSSRPRSLCSPTRRVIHVPACSEVRKVLLSNSWRQTHSSYPRHCSRVDMATSRAQCQQSRPSSLGVPMNPQKLHQSTPKTPKSYSLTLASALVDFRTRKDVRCLYLETLAQSRQYM